MLLPAAFACFKFWFEAEALNWSELAVALDEMGDIQTGSTGLTGLSGFLPIQCILSILSTNSSSLPRVSSGAPRATRAPLADREIVSIAARCVRLLQVLV
ncbi:MAG: hypothetical protein JW889_16530 [Verrucomicrobia bacterium]|nr:hypothetical protein [Verrucomicrobiota bacterium]